MDDRPLPLEVAERAEVEQEAELHRPALSQVLGRLSLGRPRLELFAVCCKEPAVNAVARHRHAGIPVILVEEVVAFHPLLDIGFGRRIAFLFKGARIHLIERLLYRLSDRAYLLQGMMTQAQQVVGGMAQGGVPRKVSRCSGGQKRAHHVERTRVDCLLPDLLVLAFLSRMAFSQLFFHHRQAFQVEDPQ